MNQKEWTYSPQSKTLSHPSGLKLQILDHRNGEISEMNPQIPQDMDRLESIQLIRAGTEYFRLNYRSLAHTQPEQPRFDTILSLKR